HGNPMRDAMQPTSERIAISNGPCPASENEKRRLKGVFTEMHVVEKPAAHAQDQRTVAFHKRRERHFRDLSLPRRIPLEQIPIGERAERAGLKKRSHLVVQPNFRSPARHATILSLLKCTPHLTSSLRHSAIRQVPILFEEIWIVETSSCC